MELSLKYFIKRNIRNLTVAFMILGVIVTLITIQVYPSLINLFVYYKLDYEKAFIDSNLFDIQGSSEAHFSQYGKNNLESQDMYNYLNVYKQSSRYKFRVKPVEVYDLDISRTTSFKMTNKEFTNYRVVALDTGDAIILARVKPNFEITPNHEYKGVFVPLEKELVDKLEEGLGKDGEMRKVFTYEFDTTNSFSYNRVNDLAFLLIPLTLFIFWGIKLITYKTNYRNHPTYKLLDKMPSEPHELEAFIDSELADKENVSINKKVYTTKNWIITKDLFKTRICRTARSGRFGN